MPEDPIAMLQDMIMQSVVQVLQQSGIMEQLAQLSNGSGGGEGQKQKKPSNDERLAAIEQALGIGQDQGSAITADGFSAGSGEGSDGEGTMGLDEQLLAAGGGPLGAAGSQALTGLVGSPTGDVAGTLNKRGSSGGALRDLADRFKR
jgi:hypothetical protein